MNLLIKNIFKWLRIYHPLQSFYRDIIFAVRNNKYRRQYRKYSGSGFTCNICGITYRQFVPDFPDAENMSAIENNQVVAGYGENIFCPNCLSTARERLVIAFLKEQELNGKTILHLSPEKPIYTFLKSRANVITADLLPGFYKAIDKKVQEQDATRLGFEDNNFDVVIANHVFEHIPDDGKAMREIFRVMKPGAMAILQIPYSKTNAATIEETKINDAARQSALFGQRDHVRIYQLNDYITRLRQAGFIVELPRENDWERFANFAVQQGENILRISKPVSSLNKY